MGAAASWYQVSLCSSASRLAQGLAKAFTGALPIPHAEVSPGLLFGFIPKIFHTFGAV